MQPVGLGALIEAQMDVAEFIIIILIIIIIIIIIIILIGAFISIFTNQLKAPQVESFETCCQWALLNVQIVTLYIYSFHLLYRSTFFPPVNKVHAGYFLVFVIHRTLTQPTGSLTCVHEHSCACVYTRGLSTPTASQHNIFDSEKRTSFSCAPDGIRTSVLWISPQWGTAD